MQSDYAGALLNRALYALEGAWHPAFKACMLRGDARLPAGAGANGLLFAALSRRVRVLCLHGMHRTALEWAKLTLRLDDTDPAGMLFHIDYLALRARECAAARTLPIHAVAAVLPCPCPPDVLERRSCTGLLRHVLRCYGAVQNLSECHTMRPGGLECCCPGRHSTCAVLTGRPGGFAPRGAGAHHERPRAAGNRRGASAPLQQTCLGIWRARPQAGHAACCAGVLWGIAASSVSKQRRCVGRSPRRRMHAVSLQKGGR